MPKAVKSGFGRKAGIEEMVLHLLFKHNGNQKKDLPRRLANKDLQM